MNYKDRPKINPKIIFNNLLPNTKTALIIGENNSDIFEILKNKKISTKEFKIRDEKEILTYLNDQEDKKFDIIIFNFELCNFHRLGLLIQALINKGEYSIIRFRNHDNGKKITKKKRIYKILKNDRITVLKKFYGRKNFVSSNICFKPFAYYSAYFIKKDSLALNCEPLFIDKIKRILSLRKEPIKLSINKKENYGK